jgi:predicted nicotinamide N-methyase
VTTVQVHVGASDYALRLLADKQQFSDPDGEAEKAGISSALWSLFGVLWPAGRVLAEEMSVFPLAGKSVLEIGCGLGLASLICKSRGADITASDYHPLAGEFLAHNTTLNHLNPIAFHQGDWGAVGSSLGRFDLIIGSDILYERQHPEQVAAFLDSHANPTAEIVLTDPGRGRCGQLRRRLADQGYVCTDDHRRFETTETPPFRGRLSVYRRDAR